MQYLHFSNDNIYICQDVYKRQRKHSLENFSVWETQEINGFNIH